MTAQLTAGPQKGGGSEIDTWPNRQTDEEKELPSLHQKKKQQL